jgi:hypothetical protein
LLAKAQNQRRRAEPSLGLGALDARKEHRVSPMRKLLVPLLCASLAATALPVARSSAAPLPMPGIGASDTIVLIDRRGRGRYYGGRRGHRDRGPGAAGIIGAIIAGTLIAAAIREGRAGDDDIARCEEEFYSFDPETGTYINRYGEERVCPYLR